MPVKTKKKSATRLYKRRRNPETIAYRELLSDLDPKLYDILLYGIYGRFYYQKDLQRNIDSRSLGEMIDIFEKHISYYAPMLEAGDILQLRYWIFKLKRLSKDTIVLLPQEFGDYVGPLEGVYTTGPKLLKRTKFLSRSVR